MPADLTLWSDASTDLVLDWNPAGTGSFFSATGPTPAMTRAATGPATYFDSTGTLRTAATNLLFNSQDPTQWTQSNTTTVAGIWAAPDRSFTAGKLTPNTGLTSHFSRPNTPITVLASTAYTTSLYIKYAGYRWFHMKSYGTAAGNPGAMCDYDLFTGTASSPVAMGTGTAVSSSMQSVGDGWYRITLTAIYDTQTSARSEFYVCNDSAAQTFGGDGGSGTLVWGAQLELGTVATPLIRTGAASGGAPRLDYVYNGSTWVNRGMLIEEARTNTFTGNQALASTFITLNGTASGSQPSPDSNSLAILFTESANNAPHRLYTNLLSTSAAAITRSFYAKSNGRRWVSINDYGADYAWFDLQNGVVGTVQPGLTASIVNVGNGWYRCIATKTYAAGSTRFTIEAANADGATSYLGDGTSGVYIFGCQMELGSAASSYIPTTASTATRPADNVSITGNDFAWMLNQLEGTVAVEADSANTGIGNQCAATIYQASNSYAIVGRSMANLRTDAGASVYVGGAAQASLATSAGVWPQNTVGKVALAYKRNDFAMSAAGAAALTDTSGELPAPTALYIGSFDGTQLYINGHIGRLRIWGSRYPNATLQQLSS